MITKFNDVIELIRKARIDALKSVNKHLIELYWNVGEHISKKVELNEWGKGTVEELSVYILNNEPDIKGFSSSNIWRMKQFFETYSPHPKLVPLVREISWTNNLLILSKSTSIEEKEFYIRLSIKEKYGKRELARQIDSGFYERTILAPVVRENKNLSTVLTELHPQASNYFKDTYILDFLNLPELHSEFQLQKAILQNLKVFILEIGKDFTFIGEEYQLQVGNKDFYVDLLFYHRELCCLVAFELKIDDFKPEYLGKLEFYLEALDRDVKKPNEKSSVGVLLCKSKDSDVVEYALNRSMSPALVAEYKTKLLDKKLLQAKLREFYEVADDVEKMVKILEQKMAGIDEDKTLQKELSFESFSDAFEKSIKPLLKKVFEKMDLFTKLFYDFQLVYKVGDVEKTLKTLKPLYLPDFLDSCYDIIEKNEIIYYIEIYFKFDGFKKSGTNPFGSGVRIAVFFTKYIYIINSPTFGEFEVKKMYHQVLTEKEKDNVVLELAKYINNGIEHYIENLKNE